MLALVALAVYTFALAAVDIGDEGFGYRPAALVRSLVVVIVVSAVVTYACAAVVRVPPNSDSWLITALILFFVMPVGVDAGTLKAAALGAVAASLSKYVLVWRRRLIVNPVVAGAVTCYVFSYAQIGGIAYLSWWVASRELLIPMIVIGVLTITALREWPLIVAYLAAALSTAAIAAAVHPTGHTLALILNSTPLLFLGVFMLPEPLTSPATRRPRLAYGALVGTLMYSSIYVKVTETYAFGFDPEIALLVGCLFAFAVRLASGTARRVPLDVSTSPMVASTYRVSADGRVAFRPGQWATVSTPHWRWPLWVRSRRVFSFASAPNASSDAGLVEFGFTVSHTPSRFKDALIGGARRAYVDNVGGDFVLAPRVRRSSRVVLISSGIGITPFASMLRSLLDDGEDLAGLAIVHVVRAADRAAYADLVERAAASGALVGCVVSAELADGFDAESLREVLPSAWTSADATHYFISGAPAFVGSTARSVRRVDPRTLLRPWRIHTDSFTGY
nr:FAD-dependent oxidoreductase [Gordonia araii]